MTPLEQTPTQVVGQVDTGPPALPAHHVLVRFGAGIPADLQAKTMFDMEKYLRDHGVAAEVLKEAVPDDSVLRRTMTAEQRKRL